MPIVTDQGIYTEELCENSKKYLSCLLIGKTGINPNFLTWELLLTEKFNLRPFFTLPQTQVISKQAIIDKLVAIETQYTEEYLKPYDPEIKKQLAELRSERNAWISIAIIVSLTSAFAVPFALGLLGSSATLMGVAYLTLIASLSCYSIIPGFFGERLIDPEWIKEFYNEKEKRHQKITSIKEVSKPKIISEAVAKQHYHSMISFFQQSSSHYAVKPSMTAPEILKRKIFDSICFFKTRKPEEACEIIHLKSFNTAIKS